MKKTKNTKDAYINSDLLLSDIKNLCEIDEDNDIYDLQLKIFIDTAIDKLTIEGIPLQTHNSIFLQQYKLLISYFCKINLQLGDSRIWENAYVNTLHTLRIKFIDSEQEVR